MSWRMTYNNLNGAACSARGIALGKSKKELEALAADLKETISNVKIEKIEEKKND